jgi:hypothetical protein
MFTIVRHKRTGNEYILLSINGEENKTTPSRFINDLFTQEKSEVSCLATVCDVRGDIFLVYIDDLIVIEVDGKKVTDILPQPTVQTISNSNNVVQHPEDDLTEDELEDEEFDDEQDITPKTQTTESYISGSSNQKDIDDDEDWI